VNVRVHDLVCECTLYKSTYVYVCSCVLEKWVGRN